MLSKNTGDQSDMAYATLTPGFSVPAEFVTEQNSICSRHLRESSAFGIGSLLREEFSNVWEECRVANWDGYNALAVTQETLRFAYTFLESLPLGFPRPSIGAEPDGHLTVEWHQSRRRTLSVSISPDGELHYAALLGLGRTCGTEPFFGEIPESILDLVGKVYSC